MPASTSSVTDAQRSAARALTWGVAVVVAIMGGAALLLLFNLPYANVFNTQVEQLFVKHDDLTAQPEIQLLEILAQSGTAFEHVLNSYRVIIAILAVFATALLLAALVFAVILFLLSRRLREIGRRGLEVLSFEISREHNTVSMNGFEFSLTPAAIETLAVLAEARMDDDVLSGAEIEAVISGRNAADCDEAAGATRIKRLRDVLGNQLVSDLLIRNVARKGYVLTVGKDVLTIA
jgi:DNA-binding winged helix-turn-helix (wHTH) protein